MGPDTWGHSHLKWTGAFIGNFEEKPQGVARSCFVGVAWNLFSSKRYHFLHNTSSPVIVFLAQYPKKVLQSFLFGPFAAHNYTLRGTKPLFQPLKGTVSTPISVYCTNEYVKTTVQPPVATISHKRPPLLSNQFSINCAKSFPVKSLYLEPPVSDHLL